MKKLLIGYVAVTLLGIALFILMDNGIIDRGGFLPSPIGMFMIVCIPEFFLIGSFFADHKLGQFHTGMIPMFLVLFTVKFIFVAGLGSAFSYLWNFKLEDIS